MNLVRQQHRLLVESPKPPVIELDVECGAIYVRFRDRKVAKTFERSSDTMIVTIDVDRSGEVVGIEGLGFNEFTLSGLLKAANVGADNVDFSKARFRAAPRNVARDLVSK
jgi:uncharacterized protein YuzE